MTKWINDLNSTWHRTAVGSAGMFGRNRAFVWTEGATRKKLALISTHGAEAFIDGDFPKGSYKLRYFSPHGVDLVNPLLTTFIEGDVQYTAENLSGDNPGQDYFLTKFQDNRPSKGHKETYKDIQLLPRGFRWDIITVRGLIQLSTLIALLIENKFNYDEFYCLFCRGSVWGQLSGTSAHAEAEPLPDSFQKDGTVFEYVPLS
jgi:putative adhesin Stv-like protein